MNEATRQYLEDVRKLAQQLIELIIEDEDYKLQLKLAQDIRQLASDEILGLTNRLS
jgi:hypothetical protein